MKASTIVALLATVCLTAASPVPEEANADKNHVAIECTGSPSAGTGIDPTDTFTAVKRIPQKGSFHLATGKCKDVSCKGHTVITVCNYREKRTKLSYNEVHDFAQSVDGICGAQYPDNPIGQGHKSHGQKEYEAVFLGYSKKSCK